MIMEQENRLLSVQFVVWNGGNVTENTQSHFEIEGCVLATLLMLKNEFK
ncbi:hypothetical protein CA11_33120 [Gimesia maris]|nr:hypothetical protein CA11_33120 [Gimesia maris]